MSETARGQWHTDRVGHDSTTQHGTERQIHESAVSVKLEKRYRLSLFTIFSEQNDGARDSEIRVLSTYRLIEICDLDAHTLFRQRGLLLLAKINEGKTSSPEK